MYENVDLLLQEVQVQKFMLKEIYKDCMKKL